MKDRLGYREPTLAQMELAEKLGIVSEIRAGMSLREVQRLISNTLSREHINEDHFRNRPEVRKRTLDKHVKNGLREGVEMLVTHGEKKLWGILIAIDTEQGKVHVKFLNSKGRIAAVFVSSKQIVRFDKVPFGPEYKYLNNITLQRVKNGKFGPEAQKQLVYHEAETAKMKAYFLPEKFLKE